MNEFHPVAVFTSVETLADTQEVMQHNIAQAVGLPKPVLFGEVTTKEEDSDMFINTFVKGLQPFTFKMHVDQDKIQRIVDGAIMKAMKTYGPGRRKIVRRAKRRIRKCIYSEVVPYNA